MQPEVSKRISPNESESDQVRSELLNRIGEKVYQNWFENKTSFYFDGDQLTIGVPSPFVQNWMQKTYRTESLEAAQAVLGASAMVHFRVDPELTRESIQDRKNETGKSPVSNSSRKVTAEHSGSLKKNPPRKYSDFSEFVTGPSNEMALLASKQISENPSGYYNPLYLYGGVGLGKTHLLEAIHRRIRKERPELRVMLIRAEVFANYFTQALREHGLPGFRQKFRKIDVLLVDEIEFFDSKNLIQEEFLNTFKQLQSEGKQIIVSADRHPGMLMKISDELKSRFVSGLVCRIESPDLETRLKVVDYFSSKLGCSIPDQAKEFVAKRFKNNIREIQGALNCLETWARMTGKPVTLTATQKVLTSLERDCIRIVRMSDVEQSVCEFFGISSEDLRSRRRSRSVSQPRMLAMYLARKHTQTAFNEIGEYFGGRNHSTVISAQRKVESLLEDEAATIRISSNTWSLGEVIESLESRLQVS